MRTRFCTIRAESVQRIPNLILENQQYVFSGRLVMDYKKMIFLSADFVVFVGEKALNSV